MQPTLDILFSAICFMIAFVYFNEKKRVIISLLGLIIFFISSYMWIPSMLLARSFTTIEIPSQSSHYAVIQEQFGAPEEVRLLRVKVYKQHYPLLYKFESEKSDEFSMKLDYETIELFDQKNIFIMRKIKH